jgi:tripartite-type tricarboxylate transporter receptor subunit TctC
MKRFPLFAAAAAALGLISAAAPATAADNYYKGKTVRFIVGFGAGGGYDTYSRMLAPLFEKELGATVIVENHPGAGGLRALNRFQRAPADGLQMTIVNGTGATLQQVLGLKGVRFDLTEMKFLGIVDAPAWIVLVQPNSPHKSLQDMVKSGQTFSWGGSGKVSGTSDGAAFTCHTLKLKCKIITGYKGSRASALALAQGELDGLYVSETSAFRYVKSKNAKAVATWNRERSPLFPNLPTVFEQLKLTDDQAWWIDYRNAVEGVGRVLVAPPATPKAQTDTLRAAAHKIMSDKKVVADFAKKRRYINYRPAAFAEKMVDKALKSVTPEQKKMVHTVVLGDGK